MKGYQVEDRKAYSTYQVEVSEPQVYSTYLAQCNLSQTSRSKSVAENVINKLNYRKEELIKNGDFLLWKNSKQPKFWRGNNIRKSSTSKTGTAAVQLNQVKDGEVKSGSQLWQRNECSSNIKVNLQFSVATLIIDSSKPLPCNPQIRIEVNWLDDKGNKLDTGLEFLIPAGSIRAAQWTFFSKVSSAAPRSTENFLVSFAVDTGTPVVLDGLNLITL